MSDATIWRAWRRAPVSMLWATVGGVGHLPGGPGTYAAILALPAIWAASHHLALPWRWALVAALCALGFFWCHRAEHALQEPDSRKIVWDEVMGVWLALVWWDALDAVGLVAGLVAFRVLDIWKPWPIKPIERRFEGGVAIMIDDLVAGVMAWPWVWGALALASRV